MIAPLTGLRWLGGYFTEFQLGFQIGVSQPTISRYLQEVISIPWHRTHAIDLAYERKQYAIARAAGFPDDAAARLRGLLPATFQSHIDVGTATIEKWAEGRLTSKIIAEDIDITEVDLDDMLDEMIVRVSEEARASDISWRDFEAGQS